jgi:hypothetical protein
VEFERRVLGGITTGFDVSAVKPKRIVQSTVYLRSDQAARKVHCSPLEGAPFLPAITRHRSPHSLSVNGLCCGSIGVDQGGPMGFERQEGERGGKKNKATSSSHCSPHVSGSPGEYELWAKFLWPKKFYFFSRVRSLLATSSVFSMQPANSYDAF